MRHTQGPWKLDSRSIIADWGEDGEVQVAVISTTRFAGGASYLNNRMREETRGNARLIAAAPEMYDMLKGIAFSYDGECPLCHWNGEHGPSCSLGALLLRIEGDK